MSDTGWFDSIKTSLKTQTTTWLIAFLIAILSIFSSYITESLKFAINRADLRTKQYEELATAISQHIFTAEITTEFIKHDWTTKKTLTDLANEYNESITSLRKKEFVYLSWIHRYWGKDELAQFESFMMSAHKFDLAIHSLNDEFEAVNITGVKPKIDRRRADEALNEMEPAVQNMRNLGRKFLTTGI